MSDQVSVRLDDELQERVQEFCEDQLIEPSRSEVIRTGLDHFLTEQGY
jgi:predicted transcriptional regulator